MSGNPAAFRCSSGTLLLAAASTQSPTKRSRCACLVVAPAWLRFPISLLLLHLRRRTQCTSYFAMSGGNAILLTTGKIYIWNAVYHSKTSGSRVCVTSRVGAAKWGCPACRCCCCFVHDFEHSLPLQNLMTLVFQSLFSPRGSGSYPT